MCAEVAGETQVVLQAKTVARTEVEVVSWQMVGATKCLAVWHSKISLVDVVDFSETLARAMAAGQTHHLFSFARSSSKKLWTTTSVGFPAMSSQRLSRTMRNR